MKTLYLVAIASLCGATGLAAEVVFDREPLAPGSATQPVQTATSYLEAGISVEKRNAVVAAARESVRNDPHIVRVELVQEEKTGRWMFKTTYRPQTLPAARWEGAAAQRVELAKVPDSFKSSRRWVRHEQSDTFPEAGAIWVYMQEFTDTKDKHVTLMVYEVDKGELSEHDFLRALVKDECRLAVADNVGTVVVSTDSQHRRSEGVRALTWRATPRRVVQVYSVDSDPELFAVAYGLQFPSSLPKGYSIDKVAWGRAEVAARLKELSQAAEQDTPPGAFARALHWLAAYLYIPNVDAAQRTNMANKEARAAVYKTVSDWWAQHQTDLVWDEQSGLMVAKGLSPREVKQAAADAEKQKLRTLLEKDLTPEEIAIATQAVTRRFEEDHKELAKHAREFLKDPAITFEPQAGGKSWRYVWKQSQRNPLKTLVFTGPIVTVTTDKAYPLRAEFVGREQKAKDTDDPVLRDVFRYDRRKDTWQLDSGQ